MRRRSSLGWTTAVLAAKAGARYVSLMLGRIDDEGGDGAATVSAVRAWIDDWSIETFVIAASLRGSRDVGRAISAGSHCVTVPPALLIKSMTITTAVRRSANSSTTPGADR